MASGARFGLTAIVLAIAPAALAHVAPSERENNRYLSLSPTADAVGFTYSVLYGQIPGARARQAMDANHDSTLSRGEASAFGNALAKVIATHLSVHLDGRAVPIEWARVDVRLDTPSSSSGSFAVDLSTTLCLDPDRSRHHLELADRYALANPGEGELRLEPAPGVRILRAGRAGTDDLSALVSWVGSRSPLGDPGYVLDIEVAPDAFSSGGACTRPKTLDYGRWPITALAALPSLALAALLWHRRRH